MRTMGDTDVMESPGQCARVASARLDSTWSRHRYEDTQGHVQREHVKQRKGTYLGRNRPNRRRVAAGECASAVNVSVSKGSGRGRCYWAGSLEKLSAGERGTNRKAQCSAQRPIRSSRLSSLQRPITAPLRAPTQPAYHHQPSRRSSLVSIAYLALPCLPCLSHHESAQRRRSWTSPNGASR